MMSRYSVSYFFLIIVTCLDKPKGGAHTVYARLQRDSLLHYHP